MESLRVSIATEDLSIPVRRKVLGTLRRGILPKSLLKGSSSKRDRLNRAYADYKTGVRGTQLFEIHIPHYNKLSWWRRRMEQTRLRKALEKRAQREQKARANGDKANF